MSTNTITTATPVPAQLAGDRDAILQFLKLLWPEGTGKLFLNIWRPGGGSKWIGGATTDEGSLRMLDVAADYIAANPMNAYIGMCLADRDHGPQQRLSRTEGRLAYAAHGVWMDVDLRGAAHKSKNYPTSLDQVLEILHRAGLANFMPTFAVFTGGGWHLYWSFREPWFFEPGSDPRFHDRDIFCSILRRFQKLIRDTAATMNLALDSTADPERILRPTSTIRAKDGSDPNVTTFFDGLSTGRRYNQADLLELLDMMSVVDEDDDVDATPTDVGKIKIDPRATIDPEVLKAMSEADPTLAQIWNLQKPLGKTTPPDDSFSEYDMQMAGALAWRKRTAQEIADWLVAFRRAKAKPGHQRQKPLQYYAITISKALAWAAKARAEKERRENAATRKQVDAEDAAKLEQQAKLAGKSEADARAVLAGALKRNVTRMLILSDNAAMTYQLEVDGKVIDIGGVGAIFSSELTSRAVWQATGKPFPPLQKKYWIGVVLPALHTIRQEINLDEDNGRVRRWLYDWFPTGGRLVSNEDDFERAVEEMVSGELSFRLSGFAKLYGDYGCIIRAHRFTSWVRQVGEDGNEENATSIRRKLIAVGFDRKESHTVTFRDGTKLKLRDVYVGAVGWFRTFQSGEGKQLSEPENTD